MVVVMENFVEHQISKIVIRYLNDTIQRYGHAWVSCPNQEPETEFERNVVNLAAAFEKDHFPELVQLGNWLTMDCNEDYLRIKKILIADIRQKTNKPSDVLQYLLTWGGLQAVRAIVKNDPLLALEVKHFLQLTIKQELFDWWRNDGGWKTALGFDQRDCSLKRKLNPDDGIVDEVDDGGGTGMSQRLENTNL